MVDPCQSELDAAVTSVATAVSALDEAVTAKEELDNALTSLAESMGGVQSTMQDLIDCIDNNP